jgi:Zn-dependent protease
MAPGQYFLVQLSGGANGVALPTPDATGSIAMAATAGKVALVAGTIAISSSGCPLSATVADFVGYGTTANCFEGSGRAPVPSNTTADYRKNGGCVDTNDNAVDFFVHAPSPRNTSSPLNSCVAGTPPNLTVNDVTLMEGNAGTKVFTFTVSLSAAANTDVSFDIATQNGSATTVNSDYVARTLTSQIIPASQQIYTFDVTVNGDTTIEPDETFLVNITNVSGATLTDSQGVGTIQNDDLPSLSIDAVSLSEGNAGTKLFTFTVSLSAAPTSPVTFDIATADGTAQDGNPSGEDNDYVARSLTAQTIPAGSSTYDVDVSINGDLNIEPNETFFVNVTNVAGATVSDGQGVGTIHNDDSPALSINDVSANETNSGTTTFTFTVTSSLPAPTGGITFDISTADGSAQDDNPSSEDNDYVATSLTAQTITAGNTTYTFDVMVNGDTLIENNETFLVNVTNASGATIADGQGQGTIQNDDLANLVISQVYAGGGNTGAQYTHDFVEIFNHGTTTVNFAITPFSVQYAGATANFGSSKVDLTSGTMAPGQYFLVQLSGGANGAALPTPDATGSIAMAATAGKVALVSGMTALTGSGCPLSATVVDFVSYGTTANCFEGSGRGPAPSNTTADYRKDGGCIDTDDNADDFFVHAPLPRNTSSPFNSCVAGTPPNLTINDVTVTEGNSGTTAATFTVSLSAPASSTDITFDIATQENTATTANSDYVAKTLTSQLIPAGQQTYTFTVTVNGDVVVEPDESFFVNVTNASGATITDGQGVGTIQNDDLPALSINDVSLNEGNSGTTTFSFTVTLSAAAPTGGVTFDLATADGTAQDGNPSGEDNDYVARTLTTQSIPAGSSTYNLDVTVNGDLNIEPNETLLVNVTNVSGATVSDGQGVGTIQNDDSPALSINDVSANETNSGTTTFTFTVTSSLPAPSGGIAFDIATADGIAHDDIPPSEDNDYIGRSLASQTITGGNTTYTFDVTVNADTLVEPDETFFVNITNASNASVSDGTGQGTILNDDIASVVVSQLYGAGGNSGATLRNDYIEIFNRSTTTVNLAGWSIQYTSAAGTTWSVTPLCPTGTCLLVPGQYFLVEEASGGANGSLLPTPDATGTIAMAATAGKVAVVSNITPLSGACPAGGGILDLVGYGSATCFEGTSGQAPAPSATRADSRINNGCTDTNDNAADFLNATPAPRNSTAPLNDCNAPPNLTIDDVIVAEGDSGSSVANFTVSLSAPAPAGGVTFNIETQDNTATTADNDYVANALTSQTITAGNTADNFAVTVNGDANVEPDETFFVNVTSVTGATVVDGQGVGTIQNDDSAPLTNLSINDVSMAEGNSGATTFSFTVSLSAPAPAGGVTFNITTADGTAHDNTPPSEDNDYVARSLTSQTISEGGTSYTFDITVNGDTPVETNETFFVNVTGVTGANVSDGQGQGTIQNDDTANLVITQIYPGGNNSGATYRNDFIEIFNRGTTTIDFAVTPYAVQYAGATAAFGTANTKTDLTTGTIAPGQYFLIQEAGGTTNGVVLPTPDATGNIAMAATGGKIALVLGATPVATTSCPGDDAAPPTNPSGTNIIDFVAYGSGANTPNCFEGAGPAAFSTSTAGGLDPDARSIIRTNSCVDNNNNSADFSNPTTAPVARNTATTPASCP